MAPIQRLLSSPRLQAAAPALAAVPKAVLYRFAAEPTCTALAAAGTALLREPQNDTVLGQWLQGVLQARPPARAAAGDRAQPLAAVPALRWDDDPLADFAGLSSTIACECPRHVAELLMQLAHFEAYSAECRHRSAADAELHAYLQQVAATSRQRFEAALARGAARGADPAASGEGAAMSAPDLCKALIPDHVVRRAVQ